MPHADARPDDQLAKTKVVTMANMPAPYRDPNVSAFWVVDGNHSMFDALTWMDQLEGNITTKVFSVAGMVHACQSFAIKNSRTIDFLAIFGHGNPGYQGIGGGVKVEGAGEKSLQYRGIVRPGVSHLNGPAEAQIAGLNGVLSSDATVLLGGCNTGQFGDGSGLLTTVSTILRNRRVQAFENRVYWWSGFMVGNLKTAKGSDVSSSFTYYSI